MTTDIEKLKKRLQSCIEAAAWEGTGDDDTLREAFNTISQLQAEKADLKFDATMFRHGHRVASDNCVRLEGQLEALGAHEIKTFVRNMHALLKRSLARDPGSAFWQNANAVFEMFGMEKIG